MYIWFVFHNALKTLKAVLFLVYIYFVFLQYGLLFLWEVWILQNLPNGWMPLFYLLKTYLKIGHVI